MEFGYRTIAECCSNVMHVTPDPSEPMSTSPTAPLPVPAGYEAASEDTMLLLQSVDAPSFMLKASDERRDDGAALAANLRMLGLQICTRVSKKTCVICE